MKIPDRHRLRVLVHAPQGRDSAVARMLLDEARLECENCPTLDHLVTALNDEAGAAVLVEEAVTNLQPLVAWLAGQPAWSSLPFVVLTRRGGGLERNPVAARLSERLVNVTFLERPFHPTTFISVVQSALRGRQRQYEAQARMEELHESEARLRTALMAGRLGSWELDVPGWRLTASDTCKALFGRAPEEPFSYADLIGAIHPDDRARAAAALDHSITTDDDCRIEFRMRWRDGSEHWAEMRARTLRERPGSLRLLGVSADITARKLSEQTLRDMNETLERRVRERTSQLEAANADLTAQIRQREAAEEQLRQAQKMEIIGQLTGGVAHDFNNLLMAVMGNLDLLRKHAPDDPRLMRLIDGALQGAQRGAALTQRLLAFARRQELQVEPRDLGSLVEGTADLLRRSVGSGIELELDLAPGLPPALVDANQFELALLNLVVNARDAMPEGGKVTVALDMADALPPGDLAAGHHLRLTVADDGIGMDAETLKRATEPFFSTKGLGKGTGLGLSMIHGLALQLKGALHLRSTPGQGTRAELWLPATSEAVPAPGAPPVAAAVDPARPLRILFVDDDALIAMGTTAMLEDLGHEVLAAGSGAHAVDMLKSGTEIDLLITDFSMPRMNGAELAVAARGLRPDLPILLATGYAELPEGMGLDLPRLGKPYMLEQLEAGIATVMKKAQGARDCR